MPPSFWDNARPLNGSVHGFGLSQHAASAESSRQQLGRVRIARRVLRTVIEQAALSVPGVARTAPNARGWPRQISRAYVHHGVALAVHEEQVSADLYLISCPGTNLVSVGSAVQVAVGGAIEHILGMTVSEINVYIQDVA